MRHRAPCRSISSGTLRPSLRFDARPGSWRLTVKVARSALLLTVLLTGCAGAGSVPTASPGAAESTVIPSSPIAYTACTAPSGKSTEVHWTMDGTERSALIHPSSRSSGTAAPVVLALHGYGGFGAELEQTSELSDAADQHGWLVIYAEGTDRPQRWMWDPSDLAGHAADMAFLRRILADVVAAGCGDPKHILVTGISQGGWLSDMAGCELSDVVIGVVPVAGRGFG